MACRFAYFVAFEHFVFLLKSLVMAIVDDIPRNLTRVMKMAWCFRVSTGICVRGVLLGITAPAVLLGLTLVAGLKSTHV
jgi:hypothetical protein